ncbi:DUF504 domain-containing protein, partial [Catenulispora sp. NF23]|uniref:RNA repair domain-containing protein n=1 Tax=Catenulispora pinistramenti TaxID=2705254 RepID=UPI001BA4F3CE
MRTSQEIYHRVRWDARFDASRFVLGLEQRGRGPKRVPLPSFDPHGDIPWHRVLFFEADGRLVWDRASGLDALDASGAGLARRERLLAAPFFEPRTPHAFAEGRWQPVADSASSSSTASASAGSGSSGSGSGSGTDSELRVLTWNTLWDRYDKELIHTAERRPMLLAALRDADVDVIALQEAEPALVKMLLAEEWVRAEWTLGGDPRSSDVADSGVFVLSRLPVIEAGWHELGRYKAVTALVVETAAGPVVVADTHLSSDHSANGAGLRAEQLAQLADGFRPASPAPLKTVPVPVVLVGDFNDDTEAPATRLGMTDAWTQVHGTADDTATFDPSVNPLAAISSLTGQAKRLDRVLLLGAEASQARLVGDAPDADGLYVSDHYGIRAVVTPSASSPSPSPEAAATVPAAATDTAPTARTAVAWLPPTSVWDPIQEVRHRLDPQVLRWPPHINLLFGFIPESEFDAALPRLGKAAATVGSFATELAEVRHFTHRHDSTVWLHPTGGAWQTLHAALLEMFPTCRNRDAFTPHLTIGKVTDPSRTAVKLAPVTAEVTELALLSRRGEGPMEVRAMVELGSGAIRWMDAAAGPVSHDAAAAASHDHAAAAVSHNDAAASHAHAATAAAAARISHDAAAAASHNHAATAAAASDNAAAAPLTARITQA